MPKQPRVIWTEENNKRLMDMASSGAYVFKAAAVFNCKIDPFCTSRVPGLVSKVIVKYLRATRRPYLLGEHEHGACFQMGQLFGAREVPSLPFKLRPRGEFVRWYCSEATSIS